jgi:glycine/D-amino acid oxidase-like deaminating enzyme
MRLEIDYIVVGLGLAGLAFTKELRKNNKQFIVFENNSQQASLVGGGVYNPVILKRFSTVWDIEDQLKIALPFYRELERELNKIYDYKFDVLRIFKSVEEQNNWFIASDKPVLSTYMNSQIEHSQIKKVYANFGFGRVNGTGRIDTQNLLTDYRLKLLGEEKLIYDDFDYTQIRILEKGIAYKKIIAKQIVFCEGFGIHKNPFFNYLPLQGTKGELLTLNVPELELNDLLKAAVFVMPLGNKNYRVGATFNWVDKTNLPSENGKLELLEKFETFIKSGYTVIKHEAGIRPTVIDRKPLLGKHPKYKNLAILNGLGTRGVLIAPKAAKQLYNYLENNINLPKEVSIDRF